MTNNSFDFEKYRTEDPEAIPNSSPSSGFDFEKYREYPDSKEEEPDGFLNYGLSAAKTAVKEVARFNQRSALRIAETVGGIPGDLVQFSKSIAEQLPQANDLLPEALQRDPNFVQKSFQKALGFLPTGQDLRKKSKEISELLGVEGVFEPQSKGEEISDEIVSDAALLFSPVKGKLPQKFLRALGLSAASNIGAEGAHELGLVDDKGKAFLKLGLNLALASYKPGASKALKDSFYKKATAAIPETAIADVKIMEKHLLSLKKGLTDRGIKDVVKEKEQVIKTIDGILARVEGGKVPAFQLPEFRRDLNAIRSDPESLRGAKKLLNSVFKSIDDAVEVYGKTNPKFITNYRKALSLDRAIHQSSKSQNFISKAVDLRKKDPVTLGLIGAIAPQKLALAGAATVGLSTLESSALLLRSPTLQKHYIKLVAAAASENKKAVVKHLNALDEEIKKEKKKSP